MSVFKQQTPLVEIHQIEGFDPTGRSFNRNIDIIRSDKGFSGSFRYEGFQSSSRTYYTVREAVDNLAKGLQEKGFQNIRTRINFKGNRYLAERRAWVEHPA